MRAHKLTPNLQNTFFTMETHEKAARIRLFRNIKQKYMATQLAISERTFRKYEQGNVSIPEDKLAKIAELLEVSLEDLKSDDDRIVLNNTFQHQKGGNGVVVNQSMPETEKELYERILQEKEAIIHRQDEEIRFLKNQLKSEK